MKPSMCTLTLCALTLSLFLPFVAMGQSVDVITLDATINPATAEYIHHSIVAARDDGAECLIIRFNTPGGLLKSTREIVSDLLTAKVPVVVYVAPAGAHLRVDPAALPVLTEPPANLGTALHDQWTEDRAVAWDAGVTSSDLAYIFFQAPVLVAIHAAELLPQQ